MSQAIDPDFESLLEYVRDARAFDYTGYRRPSLMRRFAKRMQAIGLERFEAYRTYLEEHPEEFSHLFNTILINVTGFFRDPEAWQVVAADVIPQILERKGDGEVIRVWSAGCASGQEPYTAAILLAEAVGEEAFRERVKIYATDVDDDALAEAREATYGAKELEAVPEEYRERYFQSVNGSSSYVFRNDLRRGVIFGRNDLHRDPPISRVDLLVSRNTLMYFSPPVQERILGNFHFSLTRWGFLMVGKAEALQSRNHLFVSYDLKRRIFVKDGETGVRIRMPRLQQDTAAEDAAPLRDTAFEHAPVAQLIVDPRNQVAGANHAARALFGLRRKDVGKPLQDLELSYRPLDLRTMIDQARSERRPVAARDVAWPTATGTPRSFDVQVSPLLGTDRTALIGVGVSFIDSTMHRVLQDELEKARRELETAYEELQSTVEELETTNEELQSTNEELETTNEELHSTNEELETMNEELHSTNEELETMNDEMRDRTDDALRANAFLQSVLSSVLQSVVVVDAELRVIAWSRASSELWGLRDDEVEGRHFLDLDIGLPVSELRPSIRRSLAGEDVEPVVTEGHDRRGRPIRCTVSFSPLRGAAGEQLGSILLTEVERSL